MTQNGFYLIAFDSTTHSIQTEKRAGKSFRTAVIPTPTEITSGCGFALRFYDVGEEALLAFLSTLSVPCALYELGEADENGRRPVRLIKKTEGGEGP